MEHERIGDREGERNLGFRVLESDEGSAKGFEKTVPHFLHSKRDSARTRSSAAMAANSERDWYAWARSFVALGSSPTILSFGPKPNYSSQQAQARFIKFKCHGHLD